MAENCSVAPVIRVPEKSLIVRPVSVMTLPDAVSEKLPKLAVMLTLPEVIVVSSPEEEMLATSVSEDDHVAVLLRSSELESE